MRSASVRAADCRGAIAADKHSFKLSMRSCPQRGSALSEVIVLMMVLVPLLYAVVVVGKFVGLRQQAVVGARYLAWERTVGSEAAEVAASVRKFMGAGDIDSATPPAVRGTPSATERDVANRLFRYNDDTTRSQSTQVGIATVEVSSTDAGGAATSIATASGVESVISGVASGLGNGKGAEGMVRSTLGVDIEDHPWLGEWLGGCTAGQTGSACLSESSSVYVDDWSAADDDSAIERIQRMVPATALQPWGKTLSLVGRLPLFEELAPLDAAFGHVDMTVLPASREALNGSSDEAASTQAAALARVENASAADGSSKIETPRSVSTLNRADSDEPARSRFVDGVAR